jgi:transcriptional regulator with XRE-family HTH domain
MLAIRALRVARGLTQLNVATKARIARSHLSRIERGESAPSEGVRHRLAEILDLDSAELLDEVGGAIIR